MASLETGTDDLLSDLEAGVLTLTLNRPEARNAMTRSMVSAWQARLAAAEVDQRVRCIVLTGAGRGFCAGGDVKGMAASGDGTVGDNTIDGAIHQQRINQRGTAGKLYSMPKPTIAALPGAAAGAGLGWDGLRFDSVFEGFGYDVVFQPRLFQPRLPAIFSVPSKLNAGRFHAVYYEGGRIADPTAKTTPYVLSEVLTNMQGVYQWEFVGGALHA